jgi:raffinose/stachyose/melibiose transport system substrate-binding protein
VVVFSPLGVVILTTPLEPAEKMELKWLFSFAMLVSLTCTASAETVIKVLHIQKLPKVLDIWKEAAQEFEKVHPGMKVQFDYLENEAFKAKLPTLLQSKD